MHQLFYEKIKQADALYHLGDFEHALVFYHRGLRWVHTPGDQVTQVGPGDPGGSRTQVAKSVLGGSNRKSTLSGLSN